MTKSVIITSINNITDSIRAFLSLKDWTVYYVGDNKSPELQSKDGFVFLSVNEQRASGFRSADILPFNHYCRKNVGYLYAIKNGAQYLLDTDDDNTPYGSFEDIINPFFNQSDAVNAQYVQSDERDRLPVINIYLHYTKKDQMIWPRGLPLDSIKNTGQVYARKTIDNNSIGVVQGLVDSDPDVDAIHRLIYGVNEGFKFENGPVTLVKSGTYCPINSQNTLWPNGKCFPLLYLPSTVTFRFTDILRGYVAQRCLAELGLFTAFTYASAFQIRNSHDFYKDFKDEIPCYLHTEEVINRLEEVTLTGNVCEDIMRCYKQLEKYEIVSSDELRILEVWLEDLIGIGKQ